MGTLRRTFAKVRELSGLRFGLLCAVDRRIAVLDGGPRHARKGDVLRVLCPIFTMGFPNASPTVKCFRFVCENLTRFPGIALNRARTDRVLTADHRMNVTIYSRRAMVMTHTHKKIKLKGQSVQRTEWKQTDGRTDRRTEPTALPSSLTRSVVVVCCTHGSK